MLEPRKIFDWQLLFQSRAEAVFQMTLEKTNPYFEGHFPENPIFPGVGIVDATLVALEKIEEDLFSASSAKFLGILTAGDKVELCFHRKAPGTWEAIWYRCEGTQDREKKAELLLMSGKPLPSLFPG